MSGIGKTQFCIGCCVQAIVNSSSTFKLVDIPNNTMNNTSENSHQISSNMTSLKSVKRAGVIYFDTEQKFDSSRLVEIAIKKFPNLFCIEINPFEADKHIDSLLNSFKVC